MIKRGSTKVQLAKTNFCLDAGTSQWFASRPVVAKCNWWPVSIDPANGVQLKLWECHDNLPAQQWYYTDDNRIALDNQGMTYPSYGSYAVMAHHLHNSLTGFCMDLDNGILTSNYKVQTWTCSDNNNNQVWTLWILMPELEREQATFLNTWTIFTSLLDHSFLNHFRYTFFRFNMSMDYLLHSFTW